MEALRASFEVELEPLALEEASGEEVHQTQLGARKRFLPKKRRTPTPMSNNGSPR